jgi:ribosomal protein S18 acetylase RimI-like enzyme
MDEYMPSNTTDKTDISYLYEIPHNISILDDSEADSVKFTITKNPHIQADGEIAHSARLENGYYLNCISSDSKIKQALLKYAEKLLVRYFIFLLVILSITLYFVQKLMRPLGTLVLKCKQYKDNDNFFVENWGSNFIISRGKIHKPENLEGFIAEENEEKVGLATIFIKNDEIELVSIDSLKRGKGIGKTLLDKVISLAKEKKLKRLWLITTNDNLNALKFYQKNGFQLIKIYPNAIIESKKIKPQIPEIGENGIPLRDEIELEITL